jgi:hypothetical protein
MCLLLVVSPDCLFLVKVGELTERDRMLWVSLNGLHRILPFVECTELVRTPSSLNLDGLIIQVYLKKLHFENISPHLIMFLELSLLRWHFYLAFLAFAR